MRSLRPLLGLKVSTLRAVISMLSPVCGLRPRREALRRMRKWPKPTILTSSLFSKQRKMMSNSDSTTEADCRFDSPWAATALMRSFFVERSPPLDRNGLPDPLHIGGRALGHGQPEHFRHRIRMELEHAALEGGIALGPRLDDEQGFGRFLAPAF